jgi:hypothetical protein
MLVVLVLATSCSKHQEHGFASTDEAISAYNDFYLQLKKKKQADNAALVEISRKWCEMGDSVVVCLQRDTTQCEFVNSFTSLTDSVTVEVDRLVDSRARSYADYTEILKQLHKTDIDSMSADFVTALHGFYRRIDSIPTYNCNKQKTIERYLAMLDNTLARGINSKEDVFIFLRDENVAFRSFLSKLSAYGDMPLSEIRDKTNNVAMQMIALATRDNPVLDKSEIVYLLTIRNSHRIIQNAMTCIEDIHAGKITAKDQSSAYLWMIMQPWISIEQFQYDLLSAEDTHNLEQLAKAMPTALKQLNGAEFPIETEQIPSLLIKLAVSYKN